MRGRLVGLIALASSVATAQVTYQDATTGALANYVHHAGPQSGDRPASDYGPGAAVSDYDNDGDLDIYVVDSPGFPNRLYRNDGGGVWVEVGGPAGVADVSGYGQMALFVDLDDDGWDDLVVINSGTATSRIFANDRDGTFTHRTPGSGFAPADNIFGGAGAGDYDRDGDLDLSVAGWFDASTKLYRNDGNFSFTDVTAAAAAAPVRAPSDPAFQWSVVHVDFDNDGWQDILGAVDFSSNYLMRNNGDGTYTDVTSSFNIGHTGNDMGIAIADINGDANLDVYITNITGQGSVNCFQPQVTGGCNTLDLNNGSAFTDLAGPLGVDATDWGWGTAFFDADLDGDLDLYVVNGFQVFLGTVQTAYFYRRDGPSVFTHLTGTALDHDGDSRGLVPFDFDDDGDVDLLITDALGGLKLLENTTPRGNNHWVAVSARGSSANRMGVGARVTVRTGATTRMQELIVGGSFFAGPPVEAHFGLGSATTIDELRVELPPERAIVLRDVAVDQRLNATPLEPIESLTLDRAVAATRLDWNGVQGADGYALTRGSLALLASGDLGPCREPGLGASEWDELEQPAPGEAFTYLVQPTQGAGIGPFDGGRVNVNPAGC